LTPGGYFHTYDANNCADPFPPRKMHIFLPREYESSTDRYPVVYMNDGNNVFWPGGISPYSWRVADTLSTLYEKQIIQKVIIVAIHPINREFEYTHTSWAPFRASGGTEIYTKNVEKLKGLHCQKYD
jgi:predicted alpha/beta superfamily hydrolase